MREAAQGTGMRILHIMSGYGGGISTFIHNIAQSIHEYGIQFDVVTYDDVPEDFRQTIQRTGGDVYPLLNPKKHGWRAFRESYTRVLNLYQYDMIHCHIAGYRAYIYKQLSYRYHIKKFIVHAHYNVDESKLTFLGRLRNSFDQQVNRFVSDAYVGCSRSAIKSIYGFDTPTDEMIVIPNSIDPDGFLLDDEFYHVLRRRTRETYLIPKDKPVFGQVGRLVHDKNHQLTIKIAEYMKENDLPGIFLIAGTGPLEKEIQAIVQARSLEEQIVLLGRVEPIGHLFPALDALIFPSFTEGLGTVAIESQAAGVPVLMSENVPRETDLGMGLVERLSLNEPVEVWYGRLIAACRKPMPRQEKRLNALKHYKYTNDEAARLYSLFLKGDSAETIRKGG